MSLCKNFFFTLIDTRAYPRLYPSSISALARPSSLLTSASLSLSVSVTVTLFFSITVEAGASGLSYNGE